MVAIQDQTLAATNASVVFTSIPQIYAHLKLVLSLRTDEGAASVSQLQLRFNGDTGNNYASNGLAISGSTVSGLSQASTAAMDIGAATASTADAGRFGMAEVAIVDYANTTRHKTCISTGGAQGGTGTTIGANSTSRYMTGIWNSTAAINQITLLANGNLFQIGSRATLYGLSAT